MGMLMLEKHVEDNSVTNILLMDIENCALKLVDEIILNKNKSVFVTCTESRVSVDRLRCPSVFTYYQAY